MEKLKKTSEINMTRNKTISDRLPHFYTCWDTNSSISKLNDSIGKHIDEIEKELIDIMRTHWIDTANIEDLDKLGELYNIKRKENELDKEYRYRLKIAVINYKGGGTLGAIKTLVNMVLRLPPDYELEIVENPPIKLKRKWKVDTGSEWDVNPRTISDTDVDITIESAIKDIKIKDPTIINLTTGYTITFRGELSYGDILKISESQVILNNKIRGKTSSNNNKLPRKRSKWRYKEYVGENIGKFDESQFDKSVFSIETGSIITFEWTANQPSCFELHIPYDILTNAGITKEYLQEIVDSVKSCGVKAMIRVLNGDDARR